MLVSRTVRNAALATASASASAAGSSSTSVIPPFSAPSSSSSQSTEISSNTNHTSRSSTSLTNIAASEARAQEFQRRLQNVQWNKAITWKDPNYQRPKNGQAFFMIRRFLSEQPRSTQQIVEAGLDFYATQLEESDPGSEAAKQAREIATGYKSSRRTMKEGGENRIPQGHPFVSNSHLRDNILKTLEAHQLIHKSKLVDTKPTAHFGKRPAGGGSKNTYAWFLSGPKLARPNDPQAQWSLPRHWQRLVSNEDDRVIMKEYTQVRKDQLALERTRRQNEGREARTEEEMWVWEDRHPETTTVNQRDHLNARHKKKRDQYERNLIKARLKYDSMKEAAAAIARRATQTPRETEESAAQQA